MRSALGTCERLGVKSPVARVTVLGFATSVHLPGTHRRSRAVVRQTFDDRESGAAIGAVDVGIPVSAVRRVEQLGETSFADRQVWRDAHGGRIAASAFPDRELSALFDRGSRNIKRTDHCRGRFVSGKSMK